MPEALWVPFFPDTVYTTMKNGTCENEDGDIDKKQRRHLHTVPQLT